MKQSLSKLEQASRHADPETWRPAVEELAHLAAHQQQAWQSWRVLLLSDNQELKLRGLVGLEVLSRDAPEVLEDVLLEQVERQQDPVFLHEIARLAARLPENGQQAVFQALWRDNESSRCASLPLLLDNLWPDTAEALEAIFSDPSDQVRLCLAIELCERIETLNAWPYLARLSEDPSGAVRAALASGLVERGEPEAIELLAAFSSDSDPAIRAVARLSSGQTAVAAPNLVSEVLRALPQPDGPEPDAFGCVEVWLDREDALECLALVAEFASFDNVRLAARLLGVLLDEQRSVLDRWLQSLGMLRLAPDGSPWNELKVALRYCLSLGECQSWDELIAASKLTRDPLAFWPSLRRLQEILARPRTADTLRKIQDMRSSASAVLLERVLAAPLGEYIEELLNSDLGSEA